MVLFAILSRSRESLIPDTAIFICKFRAQLMLGNYVIKENCKKMARHHLPSIKKRKIKTTDQNRRLASNE